NETLLGLSAECWKQKRPSSPTQDLFTLPDVRIIGQQPTNSDHGRQRPLHTARAWLSTVGFRAVKTQARNIRAKESSPAPFGASPKSPRFWRQRFGLEVALNFGRRQLTRGLLFPEQEISLHGTENGAQESPPFAFQALRGSVD